MLNWEKNKMKKDKIFCAFLSPQKKCGPATDYTHACFIKTALGIGPYCVTGRGGPRSSECVASIRHKNPTAPLYPGTGVYDESVATRCSFYTLDKEKARELLSGEGLEKLRKNVEGLKELFGRVK